MTGFYPPGKPCYVAYTDVMQSLHKNRFCYLKIPRTFWSRDSTPKKIGIPIYLEWVSRFHEIWSQQDLDLMGKWAIASFLMICN